MVLSSKKTQLKSNRPTESPPPGAVQTRSASRASSASNATAATRPTPPSSPGDHSPERGMRGQTATLSPATTEAEAIKVLINAKIITGQEQIHSLDTLVTAANDWATDVILQPGQQKFMASTTMALSVQAIMLLLNRYKDSYATMHNQITTGFKETKEQLTEMIQEEIGRIKEATEKAIETVKDTAKQVHDSLAHNANVSVSSTPTYAQISNPNRMARLAVESRKLRFKLTEKGAEALKGRQNEEVRKIVHGILKEMDAPATVSTKLVEKIDKARIVVLEMKDDASVLWLRAGNRGKVMANKLDASLALKTYVTVIRFTPVTFDPTKDREEFLEVNNLAEEDIQKIGFIKPPERRRPEQIHANVFVEFVDPDLANTAISQGLVVQNQRKKVEKCKKEPLKCFNCQRYGHRATACTRPATCCKCAQEGHTGHAQSPCPDPTNKKCANCGKNGHCSDEPDLCPLQIGKHQEYRKWNPDAGSPYFDSVKSLWTLNIDGDDSNDQPAPQSRKSAVRTGPNAIGIEPRRRPASQRQAKNTRTPKKRGLPGPSPLSNEIRPSPSPPSLPEAPEAPETLEAAKTPAPHPSIVPTWEETAASASALTVPSDTNQ